MPKKEYPDEIKAAAMAALLEGQSINAVAKQYKIPRGTVSSWSSRAREEVYPKTVATEDQRERIGHLIVDNLEAMLETTKAMTDVIRNPKWLEKQSAQEIGVLFGIITDKTYRLLEALPDGDGADSGDE